MHNDEYTKPTHNEYDGDASGDCEDRLELHFGDVQLVQVVAGLFAEVRFGQPRYPSLYLLASASCIVRAVDRERF